MAAAPSPAATRTAGRCPGRRQPRGERAGQEGRAGPGSGAEAALRVREGTQGGSALPGAEGLAPSQERDLCPRPPSGLQGRAGSPAVLTAKAPRAINASESYALRLRVQRERPAGRGGAEATPQRPPVTTRTSSCWSPGTQEPKRQWCRETPGATWALRSCQPAPPAPPPARAAAPGEELSCLQKSGGGGASEPWRAAEAGWRMLPPEKVGRKRPADKPARPPPSLSAGRSPGRGAGWRLPSFRAA